MTARSLFGLAVVIAAFGYHVSYGDPIASDSWERPIPTDLQECKEIDRSLIIPVPVVKRLEAIAKLQKVAVVEPASSEVSAILTASPETDISAAGQILSEVSKLEDQRRLVLQDHIGSWSNADQLRLDHLRSMASDPSTARLRPFLVRAVAGYEGTGGFFVSICNGSLIIVHGSLGPPNPPPIRVPIIVFLDRKPIAVYADVQVAE